MPNDALPRTDQVDGAAELRDAGVWLARHGLDEAQPTALLAIRLAARRQARRGGSVLLATLLIGTALTLASDQLTTAFGGYEPYRWVPLAILTTLVAGLLVAQAWLDRRVRRVDRRAGTGLSRRAAHTVQPGWRAVLGRPYARFAVASFAGAMALAASALAVPASKLGYPALILLISLIGLAVGRVVQLRELLARPVVAEDEESLLADVIMRVEDARHLTSPTAVWALPVVLFGTQLGWWNLAALVLFAVGFVALSLVNTRTRSSVTMARRAMGVR